jgi:2-dehydropantoate 2-reductase
MLQDLERDRAMEIDPLVSVVQEMGRLANVPTPTLDVVLALIKQREFMTQPDAVAAAQERLAKAA